MNEYVRETCFIYPFILFIRVLYVYAAYLHGWTKAGCYKLILSAFKVTFWLCSIYSFSHVESAQG